MVREFIKMLLDLPRQNRNAPPPACEETAQAIVSPTHPVYFPYLPASDGMAAVVPIYYGRAIRARRAAQKQMRVY